MYANLLVIPARSAEVRPCPIAKRTLAQQQDGAGMAGSMIAYEVVVNEDGSATVRLDGNDGGSYSEHAGTVNVRGGLTVSADF